MRTETNIYKRNDGRWEGRYFNGYDNRGRKKYSSVYAKTYGEVKEKLKLHKAAISRVSAKNINIPFSKICTDWLKKIRLCVKDSTYSKYCYKVEKYIIPLLGGKKLIEASGEFADVIIRGNNSLSPKSIKDILSVLKEIISYANEKYNLDIKINKVNLKNNDKSKKAVLTSSEQEKLEKYLTINIEPQKLGIIICLYTGLRIGEICALKWSDIDTSLGIIRVRKTIQRIQTTDKNESRKTKIVIDTPKTECSIRDIPISDRLNALIKRLTPNDDNFYFLSGTSKYIEPRLYQYKFKRYLEQAKIEYINFHALRHTFATRAIEQGVDIKSLSEILGHSSVNITLEKYVHSSIEQKRKEINKINSLIF